MAESALEKALSSGLSGAGDWIRNHDRFVVIGLLFSLLPLPPACFVGLLIGLANAVLLKTGALDAREAGIVKAACWLALVNSVLAGLAMWWVSNHVHSVADLAGLPFVPDFIARFVQHLLDYMQWLFGVPHKGVMA